MCNGSSRFPQKSEMESRIALLNAAAAGNFDNLPCPQCGRETVDVYYTQPAPEIYRSWFLCRTCAFEMRAQNSVKPTNFSEARSNERLEDDDRALQAKKELAVDGDSIET